MNKYNKKRKEEWKKSKYSVKNTTKNYKNRKKICNGEKVEKNDLPSVIIENVNSTLTNEKRRF